MNLRKIKVPDELAVRMKAMLNAADSRRKYYRDLLDALQRSRSRADRLDREWWEDVRQWLAGRGFDLYSRGLVWRVVLDPERTSELIDDQEIWICESPDRDEGLQELRDRAAVMTAEEVEL